MAAMMPAIERLTLAEVTRLPKWHPEHATFEPFPVHAWVVRHPDGAVLIDAGIGLGNELIDDWYGPEVTPVQEALGSVGVDVADVTAVVLSHLHFDHCGQHQMFDVPVYVQAAELEAAQRPHYTIAEWATIPNHRLRSVHGDHKIVPGVRIVPTPGHTPGHQSVVVDVGDKRVVLAAQCAFRARELRSGEPAITNLHDESWRDVAARSLARIGAMAPLSAHLSHDRRIVHLE